MNSSVSDRVAKTYRADGVETRYVEADGVRFAYRRLGPENSVDTTPLVFLHRFRGTLDDWDPAFIDAMASTRDVILFSDAGLGSSTGELATSIEAKARNAAAFIRALDLGSVDVLGFSMGGFSCQEIALAEPDLVRKVVLVGAARVGTRRRTRPPTSSSPSPCTPSTPSRTSATCSSRREGRRRRRPTSTATPFGRTASRWSPPMASRR